MIRPRVLLYHGFCREPLADDPFNLFVPLDAFRRQLDRLCSGGWWPLDLTAYLAGRAPNRRHRAYLLTIDDGYQSVVDLAAPLLASAGVPAVLFVPPQHIGARAAWLGHPTDAPLMDAETLRSLPEMGIEIGVHGFDHAVMTGMTDDELHRQTWQARESVADIVGVLPRSFAYPYGLHDHRARRAVERAGFSIAFSVVEDAGPYAVSRVDVNGIDTDVTFGLKLMPGYRRASRLADHLGPAKRWGQRLLQTRSGATP